jgi:hypothetical protein
MRRLLVALCVPAFFLCCAAAPASAQASRTWVSGLGDDANPCSRTAPCKTFAGAIAKTTAGGEIDALDPGGFGAVTITKSITIDGGAGQVASVLASGTNGIVINAGANDVVTLRNLGINGLNHTPTPGLNGVRFLAGAALHIENCRIFGFSQSGVDINLGAAPAGARVSVTRTVVSDSAVGINARSAAGGAMFVSVQGSTLAANSSIGLNVDGGGGGQIVADVSDSFITGNGTGISSIGGPHSVGIQVTRSSVVSNATTGAVSNGSGGTAFVIFSNSLISGNGTGLSSVGGGNVVTYKNNAVNGNFTDGAFTSAFNPE